MAKSPSITILERDMSTYTVTSSETVLAVVGYATKGPIGQATLVTSRAEFNEVFGTPVPDVPYSALAVYRAFNQGNQVIFYRVADDTAVSADMTVTNPVPGTAAYQAILHTSDGFDGLTPSTTYTFTVAIDGGTAKTVSCPATALKTSYSASEIASLILAQVAGTATVSLIAGPRIRITSNTIGTGGSVAIVDGVTDGLIAKVVDSSIEVAVAGVNPVISTTDNIRFTAIEKGTSTNKIAIQKSSRINPITLETIHTVTVWYDGVLKETFDDVSLTIADDNYFLDVINADPDNGGSAWVTVDVQDLTLPAGSGTGILAFPDNATDEFYTLGEGTIEYTGGDTIGEYDYKLGEDGVPALVADEIALFTDALSTTGDLGNAEEFDFHILITPDLPVAAVQDAALLLAEFRKDFMYLVDPPFALSATQVIDWHNGKVEARQSPLNSSYGALYWSWLKDFNATSREYVWCPPSVFMAEKYMEIDRNYGPWYAAAGDSRGRIIASDYEVSPSFAQRESLYGDFNAVNPFVNFSSKGLLVYGQKTLLRENSALNRVNTRRMVIYIKKLVKKAMDSMLFEPHNPDSWRKAAGKITAILEPIRQASGLDQYLVTIDSTTNTPDIIAQSIMKGIIKLVPTGTIEVIELSLQVNSAGSSLSE
jgi:uncharacterized protein